MQGKEGSSSRHPVPWFLGEQGGHFPEDVAAVYGRATPG